MWYEDPERLKVILPILGSLAVAFIALFGAVRGFMYNEARKREWEILKRKEDRYIELIRNSRAFYNAGIDSERMEKFLEELNVAWIYCPRNIVEKTTSFLEIIKNGEKLKSKTAEDALAELIIAIREDMEKAGIVEKAKFKLPKYSHYSVNPNLPPKN
jgi:hypothetical protein